MSMRPTDEFTASDDAAQLLSLDPSAKYIVDATDAGFGALFELLMLKRAFPDALIIRDKSTRGQLFRSLLGSGSILACRNGLGLYHASPGKADTSGEATDFAEMALLALRRAGLQNDAALRFSGALHELLGNVDEHGGSDAVCLSGFLVRDREAYICVADTGVGVLAGYKNSSLAAQPVDAVDALKWAVLEHRSRTGLPGRGTGFQTVVNAFRSLDASMRVRSDGASVEIEQHALTAKVLLREQGTLTGFIVSVHIGWRNS